MGWLDLKILLSLLCSSLLRCSGARSCGSELTLGLGACTQEVSRSISHVQEMF